MLIKYDRDTFKILGFYTGNINDIKLEEKEAIKELNVQDCSQTDIRVYNEDGTIKILGEQIKEGILVLKDNEVIKDGVVVELNKVYEEDYIRLIQRDIETLDDNKKIEYDKYNKKYLIVEKTIEEKLEDGLITKEEYNDYIVQFRQGMYINQLDGLRAELLDMILYRLGEEGFLIESEKELLSLLNNIREKIKLEYKKL